MNEQDRIEVLRLAVELCKIKSVSTQYNPVNTVYETEEIYKALIKLVKAE